VFRAVGKSTRHHINGGNEGAENTVLTVRNLPPQSADGGAGADSYSSTLAYHFRASVDCWYQGREAFSDGHYGLAMQLAECAQDLLDDMPWMKQAFPVPVVLDGIWGADAEEEGVT
jgi:hypothetical protein